MAVAQFSPRWSLQLDGKSQIPELDRNREPPSHQVCCSLSADLNFVVSGSGTMLLVLFSLFFSSV